MTTLTQDKDVYFIHRDIPRTHERGRLSGEFAVHRDGRSLQGAAVRVLPEGEPLKLSNGESPISGPHKLNDVVLLTNAQSWMNGSDVAKQMSERDFNAAAWSTVEKIAEKRNVVVPHPAALAM